MAELIKRFNPVIILMFAVAGVLFLLRLPYLPIFINTPIGLGLLLAFQHYVRLRYNLQIPVILLLLVLAAIEVDALGNVFNLYNQRFKVIQYDEFSHCLTSALVLPVIVWLVRAGITRTDYRLPIGLIAFFTFTTVFTLAGFYEVIELWDDKYMHASPGWRIHGPYDTANDLQWDFIGMGVGAILSYFVLRRYEKNTR